MTDFGNSRRNFLKALSTTTIISAAPVSAIAATREHQEVETLQARASGKARVIENEPPLFDGPGSALFKPVPVNGNTPFSGLTEDRVSARMAEAAGDAPNGAGTAWGIPFEIGPRVVHLKEQTVNLEVNTFSGQWLVFLHSSDSMRPKRNADGFYEKPFKGNGQLNEHVADYIVVYADDSEERIHIRERYHIGMFEQGWGENCIQAVADHKPHPVRPQHEQSIGSWGNSQTQVNTADRGSWINWLYAWENPSPGKKIKGFRFEPLNKTSLVLSAISVGNVKSNPLRWNARQKALLTLPANAKFDPTLQKDGLLSQIRLDMGQVISATPRRKYPNSDWANTVNNMVPERSEKEIIIEYAAHPEAQFYMGSEKIPVSEITGQGIGAILKPVAPAQKYVKVRVVEKGSTQPVPVKFHAHGEADEYLAPADRHRRPNNAWFEDYSVDFVHAGGHNCTYIPGETLIKLPEGKVYIEVSKGFEIKPVRKVVEVSQGTEEIVIEIDRQLDWRSKGWITADTHVHFLSPPSAQIEGSAEGVNVVNLLASQWGELMTNVGDFDGKTTHGSKEAGGEGEYLVRVGTENRQHVMGHISLLGYNGSIISPMTTGGSDESAIGDPIEVLLTEWAQQCKKQGGVVVLPHFPNPRLENAAAIVTGSIDGVEMTSWGNLYGGIDPYTLTDWYRYLNCGYFVAAVGGTDKMSAGAAVGAVRTYAKLKDNEAFSYNAWKEAVRRGQTFVTYGPLIEFVVDGKPAGSSIEMSATGGTVDVSWEVASITVPMKSVELIVNGEVRERVEVSKWKGKGNWIVKTKKSSWLALLVRGHYDNKPEIIAAHTSPVMINVKDSPMMAAADAMTILEQIEGAMAYMDTIGTRAEDKVYKRMRMVLQSAHRMIHNRMHEMGHYHSHNPMTDHPEHHK